MIAPIRYVPLVIIATVIIGIGCSEFDHGGVRGKIVDVADGSPIQGAVVAVGGESDVTDAAGEYAISGIRTGNKIMVIKCDGYQLPGAKAETMDVNIIKAMTDLPDIGPVKAADRPPQQPDKF